MLALPRHIALINQKGGVGKTTTTANLAAALARAGRRVLLADLDPQAHLTMHYGIEPAKDDAATVYDVLADGVPLAEALRTTTVQNVRILPASIDLAAAEVELVGVVGREVLLRDAMAGFRADPANAYDYLLLDCPPSLGLLTLNALAAATEVVICLQPHFLALQGVGKLLETVSLVQQRINRGLTVSGVVLCMYDFGTKLAGEVTDDLAGFLAQHRGGSAPWANAKIFETVIRRNIKLAECPSFGQVIFQYAPGSHGAEDYVKLADEVLAMEEGATVAQRADAGSTESAIPGLAKPEIEASASPAPAPPQETQPDESRVEGQAARTVPEPGSEQPPSGVP